MPVLKATKSECGYHQNPRPVRPYNQPLPDLPTSAGGRPRVRRQPGTRLSPNG